MLRKKEKEHKQERKDEISNFLSVKLFLVLFIILLFIEGLIISTNKVWSEEPQEIKQINLDIIEEKVFHQKFDKETKEERIQRLEDFLFGTKFQDQDLDSRLSKIYNATQSRSKTETKNQQAIQADSQTKELESKVLAPTPAPKVIYDESFNVGVIGTISQIENKLFNRTFNELPFLARVLAIEEKILSREEKFKIRKKPLIERISILVKKSGISTNSEITLPPKNIPTYTIDPRTNLLINEQNGEVVKDFYGNPILVMLPQSFIQGQRQQFPQNNYLPPQNQLNPYLPYQNLPQQQLGIPGHNLPPELFLNQDSFDPNY